MNPAFLVLAVETGVVVIAVAAAVVLVVLFVTLSMRGRQRRGVQREEARHDRGEAQREVDDAQERKWRQERDSDIARGD